MVRSDSRRHGAGCMLGRCGRLKTDRAWLSTCTRPGFYRWLRGANQSASARLLATLAGACTHEARPRRAGLHMLLVEVSRAPPRARRKRALDPGPSRRLTLVAPAWVPGAPPRPRRANGHVPFVLLSRAHPGAADEGARGVGLPSAFAVGPAAGAHSEMGVVLGGWSDPVALRVLTHRQV